MGHTRRHRAPHAYSRPRHAWRDATKRTATGAHRACTGKYPYSSKAIAKATVTAMIAQGRAVPMELVPYKCRICGKWHNGHRIPAKYRRPEAD